MREMAANNLLIEEGILFKIEPTEVSKFVSEMSSNTKFSDEQDSFREYLSKKWINIPKYMYNLLKHKK